MIINFEKFIVGIIIGSFLELWVTRSLRHESIVYPASHCDHCLHSLKAWELIPILSYLCLRGKCSKCKHPIGIESTIVEILTGIIFLINPLSLTGYLEIFFQCTLLIISLFDQKTMQIPTHFIIILLIISWFQSSADFTQISIIFIFYLLLTVINHYISFIGNGDVDVIFILILKVGINSTSIILTLASALALLRFYHQGPKKRVPFIPYLSIAYFL